MSLNDYLICPGFDRTLSVMPMDIKCPKCGCHVEIWSDESKRKCRNCGTIVFNPAPLIANPEIEGLQKNQMDCSRFDELAALALSLGADAAAVFPVDGTIVDPRLAALCHETECPNYGLAPTCPPHVRGPEWMMAYLKKTPHTLFIKIEVKDEVIYSDQRREIGKLLHFIVIELEKEAHRIGFTSSRAFAGGSCKNLFCPDHYQCNLLYGDGACRHPDPSRPSISGFGIQVKRLIEMAGWTPGNTREAKHNKDDVKRYGLILLGE